MKIVLVLLGTTCFVFAQKRFYPITEIYLYSVVSGIADGEISYL